MSRGGGPKWGVGREQHGNRVASPVAYRALLRAVHMLARRGWSRAAGAGSEGTAGQVWASGCRSEVSRRQWPENGGQPVDRHLPAREDRGLSRLGSLVSCRAEVRVRRPC
jgi:hypothetical protein